MNLRDKLDVYMRLSAYGPSHWYLVINVAMFDGADGLPLVVCQILKCLLFL